MMEEMERALNATDQFLDAVLQDKNRLKDPNFMMYLMRVRQKHKKTFAVINKVYERSFSSKSVATTNTFQTNIIDQQCCVLSNSCNSVHANDGKNVWIVDDERERSRSVQSLMRTQKCRMREKGRFEWLPQITNSTINIEKLHLRENTKFIRASYSWQFMNELLEKKKVKEMEEKKRIAYLRNRAKEVPRSTYEPRYQQLCEKEEQARQIRHQKAMEMLKKVQSPRMTVKFGAENLHLRRCVSAEASDWDKREAFKAKNVPISIYIPPYKDEIQAYKRAQRKMERAAELIRTSHAPAGLEKHAIQSKVQHHLRHANYCMDQKPKRNVCYSRTVPNFKKLHEQLLNKLEKAAANRPLTIVTPFYFQTDERTYNHKCNNENMVPRIHRRSYSMGNLREYNGPGIRHNHASVLRNEANRIRAQKMENERNCSRKFWELMKKRNELARIKLKQKLAAEVTTVCDIQRRLKEKKTKERERSDEYRNELKAMERRVRARALIVEQQEMLIKMQRFERRYKETVTGTRSKTQKASIQTQYPDRFKGRVMMTNDQQTAIISALDQSSSNEVQTFKTEADSDSLLISDSEDKGNEEEHIKEEIVTDNGDSDNDNNKNDDIDYDEDDDSGSDAEDEESENENGSFDEISMSELSKNSESSLDS